MPVSYLAFFKPNAKGEFKEYGEASYMMLIPLCITAVLSVILGIFPNFGAHFYDLAVMAADSITQGWTGGGW